MLIIGTDEAGYGPNLGPLVVTATVWQSAGPNLDDCMNSLQKGGFCVGDSKKLFHGGGSLSPLETGVLAALACLNFSPKNDTELFEHLAAELEPGDTSLLPVHATSEQIRRGNEIFAHHLTKQGIQLRNIHSRVLCAREFNRRLAACDTQGAKATVLSEATLELIRTAVDAESSNSHENILILCDKHGGRNRYLDLLVKFFPGDFVHILEEDRPRSVYRFEFKGRPVEIRFQAKGESELPIALASMVSKYLRELAMLRFNGFWRSKLPNIEPTAGYPVDAKRFKKAIKTMQESLKIEDDEIWRRK